MDDHIDFKGVGMVLTWKKILYRGLVEESPMGIRRRADELCVKLEIAHTEKKSN